MTGRMLSAMKALNPSMFVVDEAHCVSKWGPAFRPEYADLQRLKDLFPDARVAAFTATADELTREDISDKLFGGKGHTMVQGFDRPNLSLAVSPLQNRSKQLLEFMKSTEGQSGIVYCLSRKNTEKFAEVLKGAGYKFISDDGSDSEHQMREHKRLDALLGYCEASGCRRQVLLNYFGEDQAPCGNCDNCLNPPEMIDATAPAKALFSAMSQTGQRFGTSHVIAVARGEATDRVVQFSHDRLDAFGKGSDYAKPYMSALIRQAVASGLISMDISRSDGIRA